MCHLHAGAGLVAQSAVLDGGHDARRCQGVRRREKDGERERKGVGRLGDACWVAGTVVIVLGMDLCYVVVKYSCE